MELDDQAKHLLGLWNARQVAYPRCTKAREDNPQLQKKIAIYTIKNVRYLKRLAMSDKAASRLYQSAVDGLNADWALAGREFIFSAAPTTLKARIRFLSPAQDLFCVFRKILTHSKAIVTISGRRRGGGDTFIACS